jgi:amino acid transporter
MLIGAGVVAACVLWNLGGAKAVGTGSVMLGILLLSPFVAMVIYALVRHPALGDSTAGAAAASAEHGGLLAGIIIAMWNYMGWDNASTVATEVESPQRTYPRTMIAALVAIMVSYAIPVAAVWRTHFPPTQWSTGSWADIASLIAGPWLGIAMAVAGMIGSLGIINSLTMSYSRLPIAMAEDGYAPRMFQRRMPNGAPWVSILACGVAWTAALGLSFDRLLMLDILLYGASLVLEFIALAVLRVREPEMARPFTVPGKLAGTILAGIGPTALLIVALIRNRNEHMGHISALTLGLVLMAAGVVVWYFAAWSRRRRSTTSGL